MPAPRSAATFSGISWKARSPTRPRPPFAPAASGMLFRGSCGSCSSTSTGWRPSRSRWAARSRAGPRRRAVLAGFGREVLRGILGHDREHSTHLLDTLDGHLAEELNVGRTAKRPYCHPKTVRYRLDRARDLTGRDLTSQRD